MYRKIKDFVTEWESEALATIKIFSEITQEAKSVRSNDNIRSLGRLAWHITHTLTEMPFKAGLMKEDYLDHKPIPETIDQIIATYKKYSGELIKRILEDWEDKDLTGEIDIYGQQWERRKILGIVVKHQFHHRGQMTMLMRMQNLVVPGIYGPSKEEWASFGMEPHE
jgi:uncharacterized damage-inducible protein DinB